MASAPRVGSVVINTGNPDRLAAFWTELLGVGIARRSGPYFIWLEPQHQGGISVAFQKVEEPTEGRRRLHLDMTVEDLDSSVQRVLDLGASHVDRRPLSTRRAQAVSSPCRRWAQSWRCLPPVHR